MPKSDFQIVCFFNCSGKLPKLKPSQLFHPKTAIKKNPNEIEALYHHGFVLYQLKEFNSAQNILKKVITKNKKHALAYFYLYKIAIKENKRKDISYYKSIILELDNSLIGDN